MIHSMILMGVANSALSFASTPKPPPTPMDCSTFNASSKVPKWFSDESCAASYGCYSSVVPVETAYNVGNSTMGPAWGFGADWCVDHLQGMVYAKVNDKQGVQYFEIDNLDKHTSCRWLMGADHSISPAGTIAYDASVYQQDGVGCALTLLSKDPKNKKTAYKMTVTEPTKTLSTIEQCSNKEFDQCGGKGYTGETCCSYYDECKQVNDFFSQCQPKGLCLVPQFGQCGGIDSKTNKPWDPEKACCPPSFKCVFQSQYFSQCEPEESNVTSCAGAYKQCGGKDQQGEAWGTNTTTEKTCCIPGYECVAQNEYYSGCKPAPPCSNARFGQCGGVDADGKPWANPDHDTCCPEGFKCTFKSSYFSQCLQEQ